MSSKSKFPVSSALFTGHMIDLPDRQAPRFPAVLEHAAGRAIRAKIAHVQAQATGPLTGYASGARGGDILFHEACRSLGIATVMVLPFAPEIFALGSVAGIPGSDWVARFWALWNGTASEHRINLDLPDRDDAYGICNDEMLARAQRHGSFHLIALWNGQGGDGEGGAADLVAKARATGDNPDIIDPGTLQA